MKARRRTEGRKRTGIGRGKGRKRRKSAVWGRSASDAGGPGYHVTALERSGLSFHQSAAWAGGADMSSLLVQAA